MRSRYFLTLLSTVLMSGVSHADVPVAKAPKAPSNVTVKPLGVNSFFISWKDNADNETGWEVLVAIKGTKPQRYVLLPGANITSYTLVTTNNEFPNKELNVQIRAYNGAAGAEKFSKKTKIVSGKAFPKSIFATPTKLKAKTVDDGQIVLTWKDNATSEVGYQLEYRLSNKKKWQSLGNAQANTVFRVPSYGYSPSKSYNFRIRAYKGNPVVFSDYSNESKATTKAFQAPTKLVVKSEGDGQLSFKWNDRSSLEANYELHRKVGSGAFTAQGTVPANTSSTTPISYNPGETYQFKIRGIRTVNGKPVYSAFTNTVTIKAPSIDAPTGVVAKPVSDSSATVTWTDVSARETGYEVRYRIVGSPAFKDGDVGRVGANVKTFTATKLVPGKTYEFQVRAVMSELFSSNVYYSNYSAGAQALTKDGIAGDLTPPIFFGTSFSYLVDASRLSALTNLTVTGLPTGVTFNPTTRMITGSPTEDGVKTATMTATFTGGSVITRSLVLRVVRPQAAPIVGDAFTPVSVNAAATSTVSLTGKFSDPDTKSAARFITTKGNFDVILYKDATPVTVTNFLKYVTGNRYNDTFFHRLVSDNKSAVKLHVLQGGGYTYTSAAGFKTVVKYATTLANEPGIANKKGTVSMAKFAGNPDSATSEFFVNNEDVNADFLDDDNGGFTVFGRIPDAGMTVINSIKALPTKAYTIPTFSSSVFSDVPMNATVAPSVMEPDKLVKITSATEAPILTYSVTSANEAIAKAVVTGTNVVITGVASGSTVLTVTATDLDGTAATQTITVTVP